MRQTLKIDQLGHYQNKLGAWPSKVIDCEIATEKRTVKSDV